MEKSSSNKGHRERLRKRFIESGVGGLQNYEQLELLLTYAIGVKDVKQQGKELINRFKTVSAVFDAEIKDLEEVKGIGKSAAVLVKLVRDLCTIYLEEKAAQKDFISSPGSVYDFCRLKLGANKNEYFMVLFVDSKNGVIDYEVLSEGTVDNVPVYPRKIIKLVLEKNAAGIILVHNHPSGNTEPSLADKDVTREMLKLASSLDVRVLDHIIISKNSYYSFSENNLLDERRLQRNLS